MADRHSVEAACRAVRADLDARREDARTLRDRCARAFAYCDDRQHRADAEALEIWCGAVGVTLDSALAAKARLAPLVAACAMLRSVRGQPRCKGVTFAELAELVLVREARDVEPLIERCRAFFAERCADGTALIAWFRARGCESMTHVDACAGLLDLDLEDGEPPLNSLGAVILAERLDCDRDGVIDERDALAWLVVPRPLNELRQQLQRWCAAAHDRNPKVAFDALDKRSRGLCSRRDLERTLCKKSFFEQGLTRTELDVVLRDLDADGSGCVDVAEFVKWLSESADFAVEEEAPEEEEGSALFQVAAQQLRAALLERCGLQGGVASPKDALKVKDALVNEFRRVDADGSGDVDEDEFSALVASIVEVVDDEPAKVDLSVGEEDVLLSLSSEERTFDALGCVVVEACEGKRSLSFQSASGAAEAAGARAGDSLKSVCGQAVDEMAASLDAEFVETHPLDALTRRAAFALQVGPVVSLVVAHRSAYRLAKRHVAALWRAVDADASGSVDRAEVERFVLNDAPEAGEAEFAVVLESLRDAARKTFDPSDPLPPVAQAFRCVACGPGVFVFESRLTPSIPRRRAAKRPYKGDSPNALPTASLGVWARQTSNCSRRQGALFQARLDRNCDGVVSRSEFAAWIFPPRPLDKLKALICDVVDKQYHGKLAKLWARLQPKNPSGAIRREDLPHKLRSTGCGYVGPGEVDALLAASGGKELQFFKLCELCGRAPERLAAPSPTKKKKKRRSSLSPARPATAPARVLERRTVSTIPRHTPEDMVRARQASDYEARLPPPPDASEDEAEPGSIEGVTALQARFRAAPCRGTRDALRSRDTAVLELEESLVREAALRVDVAHAKASTRRAVAAALRVAEAERKEADAGNDNMKNTLGAENRKLAQSVEKLRAQLQAALIAKQHAVHEAELRAADHFRKKLAELKKPKKKARDPLKTAS